MNCLAFMMLKKMLVVFRGDDVRGCFVGINGTTKAKGSQKF